MAHVLVATPVSHFDVGQPHTFSNGISIRELNNVLWETSISRWYISDEEERHLRNAKYWLCVSKHYEELTPASGQELFAAARCAMWALQIINPSGATNIFLKLHEKPEGFDCVGSEHLRPLCTTLMGNIISVEEQGLSQHFDVLYAGVKRAFSEKIVRLQNPILLLEHGMQVGEPSLSNLMFVMGLDMLFMAGDINNFTQRVGGFFRLNSFVFPSDSIGEQPRTLVRDVVEHIYDYRNIIAHGRELPEKPYRDAVVLMGTNRECITRGVDFCYGNLLHQAAMFLLAAALKSIFISALMEKVADRAQWKSQMRLYEHRYKEDGGQPVVKDESR